MVMFNVFRILGDVCHMSSKIVLIWAMHRNRSAEGVSLITQALYAVVFCARYLRLARRDTYREHWSAWTFSFMVTYILTSFYVVFVMLRVFARTREREGAWRLGAACLAGSLLAAPFAMLILEPRARWHFVSFGWTFSEILESVCVLPQLLLLRQTTVPTVIDSFYLVLLGAYRMLYIANWIYRGATEVNYKDPVSWIFGSVQVLLYIDFAWVYWTRQRVKLRNGTVVDGDDIGRGYLVGKLLGRAAGGGGGDDDGEEEDGRPGWAGRGISISADEETVGHRPMPARHKDTVARQDERSSMMHGEQDELDFEDEPTAVTLDVPEDHESGVTGGEEWRNGSDHK